MLYLYSYHQPKIGNTENEYEDAFAYDLNTGRFAMADGSSESVFSNIWAKALVDEFVSGDYILKIDTLVEKAASKWQSKLPWKEMKWFVKNKIMMGALSTFLGLVVSDEKFSAVAVGDTCLFVFSSGGYRSFPITKLSDFGNSPKLVWTGNPVLRARRQIKWVNFLEGQTDGVVLVMATDSLSYWILKNAENDPWLTLLNSKGHEKEFIDDLIEKKKIKNDDITFTIISQNKI